MASCNVLREGDRVYYLVTQGAFLSVFYAPADKRVCDDGRKGQALSVPIRIRVLLLLTEAEAVSHRQRHVLWPLLGCIAWTAALMR